VQEDEAMTSLAGLYDWLVAGKASAAADAAGAAPDYRLRALPREDILLFVKEIDNDHVVAVRDKRDWVASIAMAAGVLASSLLLISLLLPGGYALLASRRVDTLRQERETLVNQLRVLRVQEAALLSPRYVEASAGNRYVAPTARTVVHMSPIPRATVASLEAH
jgi:hypothetical protein